MGSQNYVWCPFPSQTSLEANNITIPAAMFPTDPFQRFGYQGFVTYVRKYSVWYLSLHLLLKLLHNEP